MLMRKPPFEDDRMLGQDSFSAPVEGGWRPAQNAHYASACAMVGRHGMDFADNGDGTLTAVRCIDRQADDLDIQFEAGASTVTAIAHRALEGCSQQLRVIQP